MIRTLRPVWVGAAFALAATLAGCTGYGPPLSTEFHDCFFGHSQADAAQGLSDPSPLIRRWSIVSLARYGDPAATDSFIVILRNTEFETPLVRATAAVGLRLLGDKRAIPALEAACADPEPIVRADVARTLGDLGGPPEIPILASVARRDPDPNVRLEAVYAMQRIGGDEAVPTFIGALGDPDESVAFAAHSALLSQTGMQFSPDQAQWQKWWEEQHKPPATKP